MGDAIVIASGHTAVEDLRAIKPHAVEPAYVVVNDMIPLVEVPVHHAVSHHGDKLPHWLALRTREDGRTPRDPKAVTHSSRAWAGAKIDRIWPEFSGGGSSSLLAVRVALALGHPRVFVAGVALDGRGHLWTAWPDREPRRVQDYSRYRGAWHDHVRSMRGRVFAPSGFLRDLLGGLPAETAVA